jgi:hypothetical protein
MKRLRIPSSQSMVLFLSVLNGCVPTAEPVAMDQRGREREVDALGNPLRSAAKLRRNQPSGVQRVVLCLLRDALVPTRRRWPNCAVLSARLKRYAQLPRSTGASWHSLYGISPRRHSGQRISHQYSAARLLSTHSSGTDTDRRAFGMACPLSREPGCGLRGESRDL